MKTWMMAANPAVYNHERAFQQFGFVNWRQTRHFCVEDIIYIYCTKPLYKVMYKVRVSSVDSEPPNEEFWVSPHITPINAKYMRLELLSKRDSEKLTLSQLQQHGLRYAPQSPCVIHDDLLVYLNEQFGDDCDE